ncbi:MAG TPA: hypothetical protein VGL53_04675 [Bryobacteraceae bacterium]|jgi:hypothetical protein
MKTHIRKQEPSKILEEARFCLQVGYFRGALDRANKLDRHLELGKSARYVAWIARVYLGTEHYEDATAMRDIITAIRGLSGGQGLAEYACALSPANQAAAHKGIQELLAVADRQHGVLITWHPTAILRLAEFALNVLGNVKFASMLTNVALGFRAVFASLSDVKLLARLLSALNAPACLWADWCNVLVQHIHFATSRSIFVKDNLQSSADAEQWSRAEDAASENVVRSVLTTAPHEVWGILCGIAPHLVASDLGRVIEQRFTPNPIPTSRGAESIWSEPNALRYRYFWYDMITEDEKNLVRNGDWAIFGLPTEDFSMALAQWWRLVESVLKRSVVEPLCSHLAQNPQFAAWDRANLTASRQKEEAIFLDKLADPVRAKKMTLYDVLLLLKKCEATNKGGTAGSRSRMEAAQILKTYSRQIGPLTDGTWLRPAHLNDENINWFRNRSSHDASVIVSDAAIGRVIARRILDGFFAPVLEGWGFKPVLL